MVTKSHQNAVQVLNREFKTPYIGSLFTGFHGGKYTNDTGMVPERSGFSRPVTKNRHEGRVTRLMGAIVYLGRESRSTHPYAAVIRIKFVHPAL